MDEAVEYATVYEVLPEGASGFPNDMDVDASSNPSANVGKMDYGIEADAVTYKQNK